MRRMTLIPRYLVFFSLVLSACSSLIPPVKNAPTPTQHPAIPRLRIHNAGEYDIKKLTVLFPDERILFGDVPAGTTTDYQLFAPGGVYNYAAYEYELEGQVVSQPVIDWVGESPRPGLDFTYEVRYDPTRSSIMGIELVEVTQE